MSMQDGFLKEIADHPDEDMDRRVYADWLEDEGEVAHAEFVRLQCELANERLEFRRRVALEEREKESLAAHGRQWAGAAGDYEPEFRRGVVERVTLDASHVMACTQKLESLREAWPTITGLKIAPASQDDVLVTAGADKIAAVLNHEACRGLRELDLSGENPDNAIARVVARAGKLALERLDLSYSQNEINQDGVEALAASEHLRGLRELNLSGNRIGYLGMVALTDPACVFKLRQLGLDKCRLNNEAAGLLAQSEQCADLEKLSLAGNGIGLEGARALADSEHLGKLKVLNMAYNDSFSHSAVHALIAASGLRALRELDVSGFSGVRDEIRTLFAMEPPQLEGLARLRSLKLSGNNINSERLEQLLALPYLRRLEELDLSANPLSEAGARVLAATDNLPALHSLGLERCRLGADGVMALRDALNFPALCRLDVSDNDVETGRFAMTGPVSNALGVAEKVPLAVRAKLAKDDPGHVWVRE